jgi:hypothetical protein
MARSQKPPTPNPSKTFRKPDLPKDRENVVRREHPILRWGDYDSTTDLYIWQKERFKGDASSVYASRMKKTLAGIWFGVENDPRCNHCERADRSCTMAVTDSHGTMACARCRINPDSGCSFANFGRETTSSTIEVFQRSPNPPSTHAQKHHKSAAGQPFNTGVTEDSDDEPLAKNQTIAGRAEE